jgi:hypothetical protein
MLSKNPMTRVAIIASVGFLAACGGKVAGEPLGNIATSGTAGGGGSAQGGSAQGGSAQGGSGAFGGAPVDEYCRDAELYIREARYCERDRDCGQPILGTSCGCTRDWVANRSADIDDVQGLISELQAEGNDCGFPLASNCDCPAADGFVCQNNQCEWNYVNDNSNDFCLALENSAWQSIDEFECGLGSDGQIALCPWWLELEVDSYFWQYSDAGEKGRYDCRGRQINASSDSGRGREAFMLSKEELEWEGVLFLRAF